MALALNSRRKSNRAMPCLPERDRDNNPAKLWRNLGMKKNKIEAKKFTKEIPIAPWWLDAATYSGSR